MKLHRKSLLVAVVTSLVSGLASLYGRPRVAVANTYEEAVKQHDCKITRLADAAFVEPWLLLKKGSTDGHAALNGAADCPWGVLSTDAPAGKTEVAIGDRVVIELLGKGPTKKMVSSEAIAAGVPVYTAADGKTQDTPVAAGTYWMVGVSVTATSAGDQLLEVNDCVPVKLVIA
jgi:hypothetical protein